MKAVITGDIINSRQGNIETWINSLKEVLNQYGKEPENWEIYRGDSFQLSLDPDVALSACLHIKSTIKQLKSYDVRMAIGIGAEKYNAGKVSESNGTAYENSGLCFENLKKQTLAIKSNNEALDEALNIMFSLSQLTINSWSSTVATVIKTALEHPDKNQKGLADILHKSQSSISEALKRGGYEELMKINDFYLKISSQLC